MSFEIRLVQLMSLFSVTNKELATECNVDPSLVSRWRNGQRFPSEKYDQMKQIALFFLHQKMDLEQRHTLQEIMSVQKLNTPLLETQEDLLTSWLSDRRNHSVYQGRETIKTKPTIYVDNQTLKTRSRPRFPLSSQTKREFHVFQGNSGKRKAALLLLQKAMSLDTPNDIYIFSNELLHWWLEDKQFQIQWTSYLKLIVMKNHRIHVIHDVNRNKEEYSKYMNIWLPMHLIGSINSHYYPMYVDSPIKETYMVIKGHMALESRSTFLTPKENICLLFEDEDTVDMIESIFLGRLVNCKPLVQVYKEQDQTQLLQLYLKAISSDYNVIFMHKSINSVFLPDSVFEKYCEGWPHTKKREYMQVIKQYKNSQFLAFSKRSFVDVIPLETLYEITSSKSYTHRNMLLFSDTLITLTKDEIILTLKDVLYTLQKYEKFNIYLNMNENPIEHPNINIEYRENHSAFFTTNYELVTPYIGLYSDEGNLMHTFGYFLNNLIAQIPTAFKQKSETIKQIESALRLLEYQ